MVSIVGYHTCMTKGGWSFVRENAPFLSGNDEGQWLTQGFYFWTDDDFFAHKWGNLSYNNNYAIVKCKVQIKQSLLLDLVGSVKDQRYFQAKLEKYKQRLERLNKPSNQATVSSVISFLRKYAASDPELFPFSAIKAQDMYKGYNSKFLERKNEVMPGLTRQQLCLFEHAGGCVVEKNLSHPQSFCDAESKMQQGESDE